jgi:HK97 family phage portal protein
MGLGKSATRSAEVTSSQNRAIDSFGGYTVQGSLLDTPGAGAPWEISGNSYISVYRGVMSIPGIWRGVNLLADLIGGVEYDAYTNHGRDQLELIQPKPSLLDQPAPPDTQVTTFAGMATDLILFGNAVAVIAQRDANGRPTAISPHPAGWTGVYKDYETGEITYSMSGKMYPAEDVFHIKGQTVPGQIRGIGLIEAHFYKTLFLAEELNRQARDVGLNAVPTGVYQSGDPDLDTTTAGNIKAGWQSAMAHRTIAVMGPNDKFQPLAWNPTEAQLIEARQFSLVEIALLLGLPPSFLNAPIGGSQTYSNVENDAINLLKFSLRGLLTRFEQAFSQCFARGTVVKADLDGFLRADTLSRYQAYQTAIDSGWLMRSEARTYENLTPIKGIDDDPQTAGTQTKLDKALPVTDPGLTQVKIPASGPLSAQPNAAPDVQPTLDGKAVAQ